MLYVITIIIILFFFVISFRHIKKYKYIFKEKFFKYFVLLFLIFIPIVFYYNSFFRQFGSSTLNNPIISGDGKTILYYITESNGGSLYYCDTVSSKHKLITNRKLEDHVTGYTINHNGDTCVYSTMNGMYVYSKENNSTFKIKMTNDELSNCKMPKLFDDSNKLLFINIDRRINKLVSYSFETNKNSFIFDNHNKQIYAERVDISNDGLTIVFEKDKNIFTFDRINNKISKIGNGYDPKISSNGDNIFYVKEDRYSPMYVILKKQNNGYFTEIYNIECTSYISTLKAISNHYFVCNTQNGICFYDLLSHTSNNPCLIIPKKKNISITCSGLSIDKNGENVAIAARGLTNFENEKYPMLYIYNIKKKVITRLVSSWEIDRCLMGIN